VVHLVTVELFKGRATVLEVVGGLVGELLGAELGKREKRGQEATMWER